VVSILPSSVNWRRRSDSGPTNGRNRRKPDVIGSQCESPGRVEAVEKRKNASYDVSEAPGFLAGTVEAPVDTGLGKVRETHSVGSICDHDFGVFTVTNIATENTYAVPPVHVLPRMPKAANHGLRRCRGPRVPLACLAPLTAWQSLSTGHVDPSLKNCVALAFADGDRPSGSSGYFRQPCVGTLASLARH
jgi:hypothetical protein